jgi:predicted hydrocarbon binding protein
MEPRTTREVSIPAASLLGLQRAIRDETGPLAAVQALNAAGYRTGEEVVEHLLPSAAGGPGQVAADAFWRSLREHFHVRGWGTLEHRPIHPAIGLLTSPDWAEAEGEGESHPACAFSSGLLAAVLSRAAGGSVAVLETECRARGDQRCSFAFGSEEAVQILHAELLDGRELTRALDAL